MKNILLCLLLCPLFLSKAIAFETVEEKRIPFFEDEVSSLKQLIETNEKRLSIQRHLKDQMQLFQKQKEEFILGNQTKSHSFSMVSTARQILTAIKEEHLSYLFASEYLEELIFFSSIAGKSIPVKP